MSAEFDHYQLDVALAEAAGEAFSAALRENLDHDFFAFALTTLSEVQYIECSLNSEQNLAAVLKGAAAGAQQELYYKWFPNEWGAFEYFGQEGRDFFRPVKNLLARIEQESVANALVKYGLKDYPLYTYQPHHDEFGELFEARRIYVFRAMIAALRHLDAAGCFGVGEARQKCIVFADVYDDSFAEELREMSVREINTGRASPRLIQEFLSAD